MKTRPVTKEYSEGWDRIFGKKKNESRMLTIEEQQALREDLKMTVKIAKETKIDGGGGV
jgi:hypothetical protein